MAEASHDFDELVERSRMVANKLGEQALWKAAMGLESWYFVGAGPEGEQAPAIGALEGRPYLLVFTDEDRAADFWRRGGMKRSDSRGGDHDATAGGVLNMDVTEAIEYIRQLKAGGVEGALFNSGAQAFQSSLPELLDRHRRYAGGV